MTKTKSLGCAILLGAIALVCLFGQAYGCIFPFLIAGAVFAMIAWSKHKRDKAFIEQAYQQQRLIVQEVHVPPMSNKGSKGNLFVPPPIH